MTIKAAKWYLTNTNCKDDEFVCGCQNIYALKAYFEKLVSTNQQGTGLISTVYAVIHTYKNSRKWKSRRAGPLEGSWKHNSSKLPQTMQLLQRLFEAMNSRETPQVLKHQQHGAYDKVTIGVITAGFCGMQSMRRGWWDARTLSMRLSSLQQNETRYIPRFPMGQLKRYWVVGVEKICFFYQIHWAAV